MRSQMGWRVKEKTPHPATRTKRQPELSRCTRLGRPNWYSDTSGWFRVWGAIKTRTLGGFRQREEEGTTPGTGQDPEAQPRRRRRQQGRRKIACSPRPTEARSSPLELPAAWPACAVMAGAAPVTVRAAPARPPSARPSGPRWPRASPSYRPPTRRRPPRTPNAASQPTKPQCPRRGPQPTAPRAPHRSRSAPTFRPQPQPPRSLFSSASEPAADGDARGRHVTARRSRGGAALAEATPLTVVARASGVPGWRSPRWLLFFSVLCCDRTAPCPCSGPPSPSAWRILWPPGSEPVEVHLGGLWKEARPSVPGRRAFFLSLGPSPEFPLAVPLGRDYRLFLIQKGTAWTGWSPGCSNLFTSQVARYVMGEGACWGLNKSFEL